MTPAPAAGEILLVEDDPDEVELALKALGKTGLGGRIAVAKDGAEALEHVFGPGSAAGHRDLRLVLLDLKLPKVGGLEVLRRIKSDAGARNIPVVVLTSSQEDRDIAESYRLGANSYLVKPLAFDDFVEVVARVGEYWLSFNRRPG